ncbi:MAG: AzlC family ABC transporter permease [Oscillospiraceae bacterium]|nr:AzlC family ABC transporter permease [Oscillospiraceae bacterium]
MTKQKSKNISVFLAGCRDGIPIGFGYLAVSFSLGIAAKNAGLTALEGFFASLFCVASAGEYVGFTMIAASASFFETAIATLVTNARYLLMGCALSQKMSPTLPLYHRMGVGFGVTDEIFGISVSRSGELNPYYNYGAMATSIPPWAIGTLLGILAGNLLPESVVSAFSVALYGMFIAVIIPAAKKDKVIAGLIIASFALSFAASELPVVSSLSEGTRTIILTVLISSFAAIVFPKDFEVKEGENE